MSQEQNNNLDGGLLILGFIIGLTVGSVAALFRTPRSGDEVRQQIAKSSDSVRTKIESAIVSDPVAESMAEGKEAARRRRIELGFND